MFSSSSTYNSTTTALTATYHNNHSSNHTQTSACSTHINCSLPDWCTAHIGAVYSLRHWKVDTCHSPAKQSVHFAGVADCTTEYKSVCITRYDCHVTAHFLYYNHFLTSQEQLGPAQDKVPWCQQGGAHHITDLH